MRPDLLLEPATRETEIYKKHGRVGLDVKYNVCGPMTNLHYADELSFIMWSPIMHRQKGEVAASGCMFGTESGKFLCYFSKLGIYFD